MSQADNRDTTKLSRRAALAGAPAVVAAMAGGTALAAVTPDPIFELIDLHRRTWQAYGETYKAFLKLDNHYQHPERGIILGECPEFDTEDLSTGPSDIRHPDFEVHFRRIKTGKMIPCVADNEHDIKRNARIFASKDEESAWIERKIAELHEHQEAIDAAEELTPRGRAYDKWNDTHDMLVMLTDRLATTQPTTMLGLAAVLAHWAEFNEEIWDNTDGADEKRWVTLAEAAQALA
jgi:hypothetical protein